MPQLKYISIESRSRKINRDAFKAPSILRLLQDGKNLAYIEADRLTHTEDVSLSFLPPKADINTLMLKRMALSFHDLQRALNNYRQTLTCVALDTVALIGGSWIDIFEELGQYPRLCSLKMRSWGYILDGGSNGMTEEFHQKRLRNVEAYHRCIRGLQKSGCVVGSQAAWLPHRITTLGFHTWNTFPPPSIPSLPGDRKLSDGQKQWTLVESV